MFTPWKKRENKPNKGGICVANHTSPIDIVILCNDGCYAMVGGNQPTFEFKLVRLLFVMLNHDIFL